MKTTLTNIIILEKAEKVTHSNIIHQGQLIVHILFIWLTSQLSHQRRILWTCIFSTFYWIMDQALHSDFDGSILSLLQFVELKYALNVTRYSHHGIVHLKQT